MTTDATKTCPFCAETILAAAIVCKHCGRSLEKPAPHVIKVGTAATCSECGGYVRPDADRCKHCGVDLKGAKEAAASSAAPVAKPGGCFPGILVVGGIGIVLLIALIALGGRRDGNPVPTNDQIGAWIDCKDFVTRNLKAPSTAEFPVSNAPGVQITKVSERWIVLGYVDAQNAFGAKIRQQFSCQVSYSGDRAILKKLTIGDTVLLDT